MNPLVSVLIVNWNSKSDLEDCLGSLFGISYPSYEVIVVDNGSTDSSVELLKEKYPRVRIVESKKNLGFAGGNNVGFKYCRGKYILFLNNDTIVNKKFLSELVAFMESHKNVSVVQPTILFHRPKTPLHKKINSVGSFLLNSGFLYHMDYGKIFKQSKYKDSYEIFSAYGACFLARKKVIDKVGLFDSNYFAYFEETDFCHRVWLSGGRVMIYTKSFIYHKGAKTAEKLPSDFIQYHSFKNRLYTYIKNLDNINVVKIFIPHLLVCMISTLLYLIVGRPNYSIVIQKAIFWNLTNMRKILKKRNRIQNNLRVIDDSEFIPKLTKKVKINYYYFLSSGNLEKYI